MFGADPLARLCRQPDAMDGDRSTGPGRAVPVTAPNLLVVADFTDVPMTCGFGYTAFVIDAYAGLIPGWECSLSKDSGSSNAHCATPRPSAPAKATRSTTRSIIPMPEVSTPQYITARR